MMLRVMVCNHKWEASMKGHNLGGLPCLSIIKIIMCWQQGLVFSFSELHQTIQPLRCCAVVSTSWPACSSLFSLVVSVGCPAQWNWCMEWPRPLGDGHSKKSVSIVCWLQQHGWGEIGVETMYVHMCIAWKGLVWVICHRRDGRRYCPMRDIRC